MSELKKQGTLLERISFFSGAAICTIFLSRNLFRIFKYTHSFGKVRQLMSKHNPEKEIVQIIKGGNSQKTLMIEALSPNFNPNYFKNIQIPGKYQRKVGKFYEKLSFEDGFKGSYHLKGKQYPIWFNMNKPIVSYEIASAARYLDSKGKLFHSMQLVTVIGSLKYNKNKKICEFDTSMLILDRVEVDKYWQTKIIATIFSSLFFGMVLGATLSLYVERQVANLDRLNQLFQKAMK